MGDDPLQVALCLQAGQGFVPRVRLRVAFSQEVTQKLPDFVGLPVEPPDRRVNCRVVARPQPAAAATLLLLQTRRVPPGGGGFVFGRTRPSGP